MLVMSAFGQLVVFGLLFALFNWIWYITQYRATKRAIKDACEELGLTRTTWAGTVRQSGGRQDPDMT